MPGAVRRGGVCSALAFLLVTLGACSGAAPPAEPALKKTKRGRLEALLERARGPEGTALMARLVKKLRGRLDAREAERAHCQGPLTGEAVVVAGRGEATLQGRLKLPLSQVPLAAAEIVLRVEAGAEVARARSDGCGRFAITGLAVGRYRGEFRVRSFRGSFSVELEAGVERRVFRVEKALVRTAVLRGRFDRVEVILASLGVPFELLGPDAYGELDREKFDLAFINCRHPRALKDAEVTRLRRFVQQGGALYFSDLTLPKLLQAWPGRLTPRPGNHGVQRRWARPADPEMASFLAPTSEVQINFNLGGWRRLKQAQRGTRVLLSDRETGEPHVVVWDQGQGRAGFTTYHHSAQLRDEQLRSLVFFLTRL